MSKHTPGPWKITGGSDEEVSIGARLLKWDIAMLPLYDDGSWGSPVPGLPNDTQKANAALMAAAPEMLEALKHATASMEARGFNDGNGSALADVKAAIAKAEKGVS